MALPGTHHCKLTRRWISRIGIDYKTVHLGRYDTEEEAHAVYLRASAEVGPNPRAAARAAGLTRYSNGKPCPQGHTGERMVSNGTCCTCLEQNKAKSKDKLLAAQTRNRAAHPERWRAWKKRSYDKARQDPFVVLSSRMSSLIRYSLRTGKAGRSWLSMVPYSVEDLRTHIERQFLPGMGWHNMGRWHIDHILPITSFKITGPDCAEFKACWSLPNLRPLWAIDNIKKHAKREVLL